MCCVHVVVLSSNARAARCASFIPRPVLDDDVDALQERDVAQRVAADGDDVRILARE